MNEKRAKRVSIKITESVYQFLNDESEKRGLAPGSLCSFIVGDWKTKVEQEREISAQRALT